MQIQENKGEAQRLAGQMRHVEAVIKMLDPTFNLRRIAAKRGSIGARSTAAPGTAQDGHRAHDSAGDRRADLGGSQYKEARQAGAGGPDLASLRNHDGKRVQRTNEGSPAQWRLIG